MRVLMSISTFVLVLLASAVSTGIPQDLHEKYNQSYNQWQSIKKLWSNSYQYTLPSSSWIGIYSNTTIFVVNGEVVGREYKRVFHNELTENWFENKDQLNSHGTDSGAEKAETLDNIYSNCLQWLDVNTSDNTIGHYLTFKVDSDNHGLLQSCGNVPKNCADDCFNGASIVNLKPYSQQQ